jgi:hypothetical protein
LLLSRSGAARSGSYAIAQGVSRRQCKIDLQFLVFAHGPHSACRPGNIHGGSFTRGQTGQIDLHMLRIDAFTT